MSPTPVHTVDSTSNLVATCRPTARAEANLTRIKFECQTESSWRQENLPNDTLQPRKDVNRLLMKATKGAEGERSKGHPLAAEQWCRPLTPPILSVDYQLIKRALNHTPNPHPSPGGDKARLVGSGYEGGPDHINVVIPPNSQSRVTRSARLD